MMSTKEFEQNYWKMFDAGIVEDDRKPDKMQLEITENDGGRIFRHFFEVSDLEDAKVKIKWLLENTPCYEVVFYNPGHNPVTWYSVNEREWNWYYK